MSTTDPVPEYIPWYQSRVLQGILVSLITQLLAGTHLAKYFTTASVGSVVDGVFQVSAIVSALYAAHARITKPTPPIVLTKPKEEPPK